jgi:hypothetical protein
MENKVLTVFLAVPPLGNLCHAGKLPELFGFCSRVLEALFNLDPLVGLNPLAHDGRVTHRGVEGLVAAAVGVVHILANDAPVFLDEGRLPEDLVGMAETIQNKSGLVSARSHGPHRLLAC